MKESPDASVAEDILLRGNGETDHKMIEAYLYLVRNIEHALPTSAQEREEQCRAIYERNWFIASKMVVEEAKVIVGLSEIITRCVLFGSGDPAVNGEKGVLPKHVIERLGVIKERFGPAAAQDDHSA